MGKKRTTAPSTTAAPLKPGDRVIIHQNPHDARSEDIVGTVIVYRAGAGFAGCDLVDVHYKSQVDGRGHTLPFGLSCLAEATPSSVLQIAERFEQRVADLREVAASLRQRK